MIKIKNVLLEIFFRVEIGPKIIKLREAKKWKGNELARKANEEPAYISKLERGKIASPDALKLKAIVDALGYTVDAFLEWDGGDIKTLEKMSTQAYKEKPEPEHAARAIELYADKKTREAIENFSILDARGKDDANTFLRNLKEVQSQRKKK